MLKVVKGTYRPDKGVNPREPQSKHGKPARPRDLSPGARKQWDRFAEILNDLGVLTAADGAALANLCEAASELAIARKALAGRDGLTYQNVTAAGGVTYRPWPEIQMVRDADRRVRMWLGVFGLSPIDRAKVSAKVQVDEDPAAKFLR